MVLYLRRRTLGGLVLYGIATLIGLYTHPTVALFAGLAGVTMLWLLWSDRRAQARWLATNVAVLAGWGWWAMISVRQMTMPVTNIAWIATPSWRDAVAMTAQVYLPLYADRPGLAGTLLLAAMFAGLAVCAVRAARPEIRLLAVVTIGTPVLLFAISQRVPIFLPRTLSWASGPELVLVALGVTRIPSLLVARAGGILLLGLSAVGLANWLPNRERDHWDQAAALIARYRPSLVIVGDDAVALAIHHYRADSGQRGPRPIVVQSAYRERWADGLYAGPHLSPRVVRDRLRTARCAVVVGWGPFRSPILDDPAVEAQALTHDSAPSVALIRLNGCTASVVHNSKPRHYLRAMLPRVIRRCVLSGSAPTFYQNRALAGDRRLEPAKAGLPDGNCGTRPGLQRERFDRFPDHAVRQLQREPRIARRLCRGDRGLHLRNACDAIRLTAAERALIGIGKAELLAFALDNLAAVERKQVACLARARDLPGSRVEAGKPGCIGRYVSARGQRIQCLRRVFSGLRGNSRGDRQGADEQR
jgi:hypothetical protein